MFSLKDLDTALKKAGDSEKAVWDLLLGSIVTASVDGVESADAPGLLDRLEKIHSHLVNAENIIQVYDGLGVPGFTPESVGGLKRELSELSRKINQDIQVLKRK